MAASAGAWYRVGKVNVTNNSQAVTGVGTSWQSDVTAIAVGDIFTLDAKTWYEVTAIDSDTSITIDRGFEGATGSNESYAIVRNTSGTILTRIAGQVSVQFNQKQLFLDELRTWLNSENPSEEITDSHGVKHSIKTPMQMVSEHDALKSQMNDDFSGMSTQMEGEFTGLKGEMTSEFDAMSDQMSADYAQKMADLNSVHPHPYVMRKVDFEARRAQNNELFAASGFVHFGKHWINPSNGEIPVNQGMFSYTTTPNMLFLGTGSVEPFTGDTHLSPVVNVAGITTEINYLSSTSGTKSAWVKFPDAPDGTVTHDTETGEVFDYAKEVDPKYGDVAADTDEAVTRAFEGLCANEDARLGDSHWNKYRGSTIVNGQFVGAPVDGGSGWQFISPTFVNSAEPDTTYVLTIDVADIGTEGSNVFYVYQGNSVPGLANITEAKVYTIEFTTDSDISGLGSGFLCYRLGMVVNSIRVEKKVKTKEVVTERVDMFGFEVLLREINESDPFVYYRGIIQSLAPNINGVPTVANTTRPATYFAWYDGDTASRGNGVNWLTASDADRFKMASDPKNNIYFDDETGKFYQWCLRGRSFAGPGNGNWKNIDPTDLDSYYSKMNFGISNNAVAEIVHPHGNDDSVYEYHDNFFRPAILTSNDVGETPNPQGLWRAVINGGGGSTSNVAHNGECYFLVCGTVPRLNKGGMHPSLNPLGSAKFWSDMNDNSFVETERLWSGPIAPESLKPSSLRDCFNYVAYGDAHGNKPSVGYGRTTSGKSGRADGRFYDAIYASGQGGVCDYRLSAWDMSSPTKATEVFEQVKNEEYRGRERATKTYIVDVGFAKLTTQGAGNELSQYRCDSSRMPEINAAVATQLGLVETNFSRMVSGTLSSNTTLGGKSVSVYLYGIGNGVNTVEGGEYFLQMQYDSYVDSYIRFFPIGDSLGRGYHSNVAMEFSEMYVILSLDESTTIGDDYGVDKLLGPEVEGEFTQTDVIGHPANIVNVDALKGGWVGSWIPDFTSRDIRLSRTVIDHPSTWLKTSDFGASWNSAVFEDVDENNTLDIYMDTTPDRVAIVNYTAFAKITKPTVNQAVLNWEAGLGNVFNTQAATHASIGDSLLGKVLTGSNGWTSFNTLKLTQHLINSYGRLTNTSGATRTSHGAIKMVAPTREPYAVKILPHQVEVNNRASLNLIYNEIIWNGTDWGDDGTVKIESEDTTYTNDNGDTCLCGTHQLAIPYGWIKNDK